MFVNFQNHDHPIHCKSVAASWIVVFTKTAYLIFTINANYLVYYVYIRRHLMKKLGNFGKNVKKTIEQKNDADFAPEVSNFLVVLQPSIKQQPVKVLSSV